MYCFSALGLENCIEQTWRDSCMYLDGDTPLTIGRSYGRVSRHLLREELLRRWFFHSPCKQTKQSMTFSQYSHQSPEFSYCRYHSVKWVEISDNLSGNIIVRRYLLYFPRQSIFWQSRQQCECHWSGRQLIPCSLEF